MCGRYYNFISKDELGYLSNSELIKEYINYNIVPTTEIPIVIDNKIIGAKWGFYPTWLKKMKDSKPLINARLETILEKKTFKTPFEKRRCLVLMSGWYEWKQEGDNKIPYAFYKSKYEPIKVAGIYSYRSDKTIEACILTKNATDELKNIHERMPVVLDGDLIDNWLDEDIDINLLIEKLRNEYKNIEYHRVDIAVNNPKNNNKKLYQEYSELPF